jgi:hypothetical protein
MDDFILTFVVNSVWIVVVITSVQFLVSEIKKGIDYYFQKKEEFHVSIFNELQGKTQTTSTPGNGRQGQDGPGQNPTTGL